MCVKLLAKFIKKILKVIQLKNKLNYPILNFYAIKS